MFSTPVRLVSRTGVVSLQLQRSAVPTLTISSAAPPPFASSLLSTSAPSLQSDPAMSKFSLADKYRGLEKNVWVEFIQLALEQKPLNLGQGLPDDLVPDYVLQNLAEVVTDPSVFMHQYTRGFGHPRLVNAISSLYSKLLARSTPIDPVSPRPYCNLPILMNGEDVCAE